MKKKLIEALENLDLRELTNKEFDLLLSKVLSQTPPKQVFKKYDPDLIIDNYNLKKLLKILSKYDIIDLIDPKKMIDCFDEKQHKEIFKKLRPDEVIKVIEEVDPYLLFSAINYMDKEILKKYAPMNPLDDEVMNLLGIIYKEDAINYVTEEDIENKYNIVLEHVKEDECPQL